MSKDSNYNSLCLQNLLQPMWLLQLLSTTICVPTPNALKRYQLRPPHQQFIRSTKTQACRPPPQRFFASHHPPSLPTRPQCQLCGKFGHVAMKCYHMFDIAFQGPSSQPSSSAFAHSQKNSPSMHAMLASSTTSEDWFFDTGATHHLAKDHTSLSNVHPYLGTD